MEQAKEGGRYERQEDGTLKRVLDAPESARETAPVQELKTKKKD